MIIFLALTACNGEVDNNLNALTPDLFVEESLDLGDVVVLYSGEGVLTLANAGRAPLAIDSITIADNDDGVYSFIVEEADTGETIDPNGSFEIEADDSYDLNILFTPETYLPYIREMTIVSNDPENPETVVTLLGEGIDGPVPDILITPQSLDFGTVIVGGTSSTYFTVQNNGDGDLIIDNTTQTGGGAFNIQIDPEGTTLSPGSMTVVPIDYSPTTESGDNGSFIIESNDPDEPSVEMIFLGNGGGDFEYPIAEIDCPTSVDPPDTVPLDGSTSYDPNGNEPLQYLWEILEQPDGSNGEIADPATDITSVFVDAAGTWRIGLSVENSVGIVSAPAECEFEATPNDSIYVEMIWNTGDSDVDLHLIQDGASFGELPGDCCWCNPNPSWGVDGDADDPDLSLDNTVGFGPESITLQSPYEGDYYVAAHYYSDNGGGTTTATVRIYIDGALEWEGSEVLTHNDAWTAAYIRWPEGVVVESDESINEDPVRGCE